MADIGDPISQPIPAVGTTGTTYATQVNAFLTEVKDRLEASIPKSALEDGVLDQNGNPITNVDYLGLADVGLTPSSPIGSLQRFDDELYWVSTGGVVKITDSGAVNVSGFGGITGDYGGTNPAQFRYVDADAEYYAYSDFANGVWAFLWARGMDLAKNSTSSERTRVIASPSLSASYTLTLPSAPPAETTAVQMDSSGNLTVGRREVIRAYGPTHFKSVAPSGATWTQTLVNTSGTNYWISQTATAMNTGSGHFLVQEVDLPVGAIVTAGEFYTNKSSDASNTVFASLDSVVVTTGAPTPLSSASNSANNPGATTTAFASLPITIEDGKYYRVHMGISDDTPNATDKIFGFKLTYTVP